MDYKRCNIYPSSILNHFPMYTCEYGQHEVAADQVHTAHLEETGEICCYQCLRNKQYEFNFFQMTLREAVC